MRHGYGKKKGKRIISFWVSDFHVAARVTTLNDAAL